MIGEGLFILAASLSGDYTDMEYIGNFDNCDIAMTYYHDNCANKYQSASCTLKKYTTLPADQVTVNAFDFDIKEIQSCGFVGVDTRKKFLEDK